MPPPPVTPSPHRFVIPEAAANPAAGRQAPLPQSRTPRPSQFNATPRFTFSSTPRPTPSQNFPASTPSSARAARFTTPAGHATQAALQDDGIENVDSSFESLTGSIEASDNGLVVEEYNSYDISERSPKRRRTSLSPQPSYPHAVETEDEDSVHARQAILPTTPAARRLTSSTAPRFLSSKPHPSSTPQLLKQEAQSFARPPRFRPPDPAEEASSEPLPEQFSPHRRGTKYVNGGLAAEVRDWLVNLESTAPQRPVAAHTSKTHASHQSTKGDGWNARIVIDSMSGGGRAGMTLVRGRQIRVHVVGEEEVVDELGEAHFILAREGGGREVTGDSLRAWKVEVGSMVGIKGPVWEVMLEGLRWSVGVDWKVLESSYF